LPLFEVFCEHFSATIPGPFCCLCDLKWSVYNCSLRSGSLGSDCSHAPVYLCVRVYLSAGVCVFVPVICMHTHTLNCTNTYKGCTCRPATTTKMGAQRKHNYKHMLRPLTRTRVHTDTRRNTHTLTHPHKLHLLQLAPSLSGTHKLPHWRVHKSLVSSLKNFVHVYTGKNVA